VEDGMICRLAASWLASADLPWSCSAPALLQELATALAITAGLIATAWFVWRWSSLPDPGSRLKAAAGVAATWAAAVLLAFAAGQPEVRRPQADHGRHVVFVVDASESATRNRNAWEAALQQAGDATRHPGGAGGEEDIGSVVVFAATDDVIARALPIPEVRQTLAGYPQAAFATPPRRPRPNPDGSTPGRALADALDLITKAGRPGEIILISDGLWTSAPPDAEVRRAAAEGVPIHVWPLDAGPPARGIVAAHLAHVVDSGAEAPVRLVVAGGGTHDAATVGVSRLREAAETRPLDGSAAATPLRIARRFDGRGLQFVEVRLAADAGPRQLRRLYTTVIGPPRLLVLGKAPWVNDLPPGRFDIRRIDDPRQEIDPREADVVVIDGLYARELHPQTPSRIAAAVRQNGAGLFLVNGGLRGTPRDPTVARSYAGTPLEPLLPVTADPDFLRLRPPPRTVAIVIDNSGSMQGGPMRMAKALARQVLGQMTDGRDRIAIDSFPRVDGAILEPAALTPDARAHVERYIDSLDASGGSDIGAGVDLVARLKGNACAAFIITDGDVVGARMFVPGCNLTYLEIGGSAGFVNRDLPAAARTNGQAEKIPPIGPMPPIRFRFFDPELEPAFFREGLISVASRVGDPLVAPRLPVDGVAISHAFPEADVLVFRDAWPADPVLAFRRPPDGRGGETGVFMSALNGRWMGHPDGREAVTRHLVRLSGWEDRERFDIAIGETGGRGRLTISAVGEQGRILPLSSLSAVLELAGGSDPVALAPAPGRAGSLSGAFDLPARGAEAGDRVVRGHLRLSEPGRAVQRIPVALPVVDADSRTAAMAEAFTGGQDLAALQSMADRTGGQLGPKLSLTRPPPPPSPEPQPRHELPLALAAVFAVIAFLSRGSRL
jgi:Mg-chelatase subunit ChlD